MFGYVAVLLLMVLTISMLFTNGFGSNIRDRRITYPQLLTMIEEGQVRSVAIRGTSLVGVTTTTTVADADFPDKNYDFETTIGADFIVTARQMQAAKLNKPLDEVSVKDLPFTIIYRQPLTTPWWYDLIPLAISLVLCGVMFWLIMRAQTGGNGKVMNFGRSRARIHDPNKNKVTFADVAGAEEEKEELKEMVDFLRNPKAYIDMGARIPKGVLLIGPPGTGKTLLAKAVAGEAGVPFFSISGSDFVEMFVGVGASRVRDLFDQAKRAAPSIIFIDEIDAVGRHRGAGLGGGHDEREQTLNQLLVEMDGFAINEGVIVMAATNRRDILDPALLRPGRFDRTILVNYPDMAGRVAILKVHAKGKPLADDVDLENIAKRVPFSTGAELENIMNEAAILAARGRLKAINQQTLVEAISRVQMGPEKRSHKVTQRDKRMVAIHEAGHAIVGHVLPNCDEVHLITIVPRGQAGGYTLSLPTEEDDLQTYSQLMDFVAMGLGGHAAEQLYLGEFTTGATSDLKKATEVCRRMVTQFGMSEKLGPVYLDGDQEVFVGMEFGQSRGYSEEMAARIDAEVKRLLEECYQKAVDALSANRDRMEKLVDALLKYDTISRREFVTLMETGALPDIQDADTRTTGDVMMQDMADEKKKENSEKSAETPEKSAETPDKTADAHTTSSDGLLTPAELVALADKHRVTLLAVTDHDTFDGAAQLLGKPTPMPILQGVELSLRDMPGLHLLGYGRGMDTPLHRKVRALSQMRLGRARQMVEKLNALGYPLDYDEIAREAKGSVGRPHIARAMVSHGYVADTREAFDRFLADGAPAYVAGERLSMAEALPLMQESGFVPVLAHPMELEKTGALLRHLLGVWQEQGLRGVEVYHPSAGRATPLLDLTARRMGFLVTGGSDFHGDGDRHGMVGCTAPMWARAADDVEKLLQAVEDAQIM